MKNLIYILALYLSISFFSCSGNKKVSISKEKEIDYTLLPAYAATGHRINNTNDTIKYYNRTFEEYDYYAPGDTIYDAVAEGYPDTIKVAFTRDGVFEDSVEAVRVAGIDWGYRYAYMFRATVGDAWFYSRGGKFLHFACSPMPHSGKGHKYHP